MDEVELLVEIKKLRADRDELVKKGEPIYEVQAKLDKLERQRSALGAEKLLDRKRHEYAI